MSTAYNGLEAEVYRLEAEADVLRKQLHAVAESDSGAAPDTAAIDAARDVGREEGRRQAETEGEIRLTEAVDAAVADSEKSHEAEFNDLLACLGQEEASKDLLFKKLVALGESEAALIEELAAIVIEDD